jgi:hypothetical protein
VRRDYIGLNQAGQYQLIDRANKEKTAPVSHSGKETSAA